MNRTRQQLFAWVVSTLPKTDGRTLTMFISTNKNGHEGGPRGPMLTPNRHSSALKSVHKSPGIFVRHLAGAGEYVFKRNIIRVPIAGCLVVLP